MGSVTTAAEWQRAIEGLSSQIDGYAELLVRKGAVIEKGQELVVQSPVECADSVSYTHLGPARPREGEHQAGEPYGPLVIRAYAGAISIWLFR